MEVKNLLDLVQYQDNAVVSTELIKKDAGTVTLFAFDKSQGLSEHTAPYDALVYILDGKAEITISKEPFTLQTGDMIIMPANQPHALKALEKFKMLLIMIKK
ncbi:MAG: cupin domain-containing protein [Candidatus Caldatribacteriota bacterium]